MIDIRGVITAKIIPLSQVGISSWTNDCQISRNSAYDSLTFRVLALRHSLWQRVNPRNAFLFTAFHHPSVSPHTPTQSYYNKTGQYTWRQYVHRGENHLNQNRSRNVCHDLPHQACTFVCHTAVQSCDNNGTTSSAITMGSRSCKTSQDVSKKSREQIQPSTISTPKK